MPFAIRTPRAPKVSFESLEDRNLLSVPHPDHVVVVIEENHSPTQVVGNSAAPYITSLANNGALLTDSHGVARPSQPNYIALFSGSTQGVTSNDNVNLGNVPNLGSQLIGAGKTFIEYSEGLPSVGYTGATSGRYARKHNPSVSFSNVPVSSNRPFTDFPSDFTTLPSVSFVVPNLDDDSHDGTVMESDVWLQQHMSAYASWAKAHNSLLIVTYDEGDLADTTNRIPTIFYGAGVQTGTYANNINHYNVLRTIEDLYALPALANAASAAPLDYAFTGGGGTTGIAAPSNLVATSVSSTQINLTWTDNATNETGYKIERSTDGVNFSALAGSGVNGHAYNNTGLTAGKKYYYRVYAVSATTRSANSNVASAVAGSTGGTTTPAAPSALSASPASSSQINLAWTDNASDETGFRIERSTDGTNFSLVTTVGANVTSWANTGLSASTKYYYRAQATGTGGNSGYTSVASATTQSGTTTGAPAAPTGASARSSTSVSGAIDLTWTDNSSNETGFKIERSTDGVNFSPLAAAGANATFYRNTGLTTGKKYYYRVYAINAAGRSANSEVASAVVGSTGGGTTIPAAPSGLTASAASSSQINLAWTDNASDETGFRIERSTDGANFTTLTTVGANVHTWSNTGLAASTRYYYRVLATGTGGNSGYTSVASATTQSGTTAGTPAAPTGLTARPSTSVAGAMDVFWTDASSNETGFKIERSTDGINFSPLAAAGTNATFYRNTGLSAGKKYYYRVYAINAAGRSANSNVASAVMP